MILLALLVVVVVAVGGVVAARRSSLGASTPRPDRSAVEARAPGTDLERWVAAGLISGDQATAIAEFERGAQPARPPRRVSPGVESLAYIGGVLLAVGAGMGIGQYWDRFGAAIHALVLATPALLSGIAGAVVGESDAIARRLRGFLWAVSAIAVSATVGVFVFDVPDPGARGVAVATAAAGAVASAAYWQLRDRPLQHLITFVGLGLSIGLAAYWVVGARGGAATGLTLALLGAAWAILAWRHLLPPALLGFPLGVVLTLVGSGIVASQLPWLAPLLGLATAVVWTGVGVATSEPLALAPGVLGVCVFLPWTLGRFFGDTIGAPAIAMLSGAVLLVAVVVLVRRSRRHGGPAGGGGWGRHSTLAHG